MAQFIFLTAAWAALPAAARADEPWQSLGTRDGVRYEQRAVADSRYREYRATAELGVSPRTVADAIWFGVHQATAATVRKRTIVSSVPGEVVFYELVHAPVVRDRDVTMLVHDVPRADGAVEIRFETVFDRGPPVDNRYVHIPLVRGAWNISPSPTGAHLVYTCLSEPGGAIPPFLVRGFQEDHIVADVQSVLSRLKAVSNNP